MTNPYRDKPTRNNSRIRVFSESVRDEDLVWHRDKQDRTITVLEGQGWQFQRDNELPQEMRPGQIIEVKADEWHRIIKGTRTLRVEIKESKNICIIDGTRSRYSLHEAATIELDNQVISGQVMKPEHFAGGGSGNNVLKRALERRSELNPDESFFFLHKKNTKALDAVTNELVSLAPQWVHIESPDYNDLISPIDDPAYRVLNQSSNPKPSIALISLLGMSGGSYLVNVKDIAHRLGESTKSTDKSVSNKVLGYISEHALALGCSNTGRSAKSLEKLESILREDIRIAPAFDALNSSDLTEVLLFAERAIEAVRRSGFRLAEARVDGTQQAKYDVVGSSDGITEDFNCHVKFNQGLGGSRFIGLQTDKDDELINQSTNLYRDIHKRLRDEWQNLAIDPIPLSATNRNAAKEVKRLTGTWPITELQFPGFFENLMDDLIEAGYPHEVAADIGIALSPPDGALSFAYFQQSGSSLDDPIEVKIIQYAKIDANVEVRPVQTPLPSKAFEVIIQGLQPFHIEIRSLRQGQPPQLKTGIDYHAFEELMDPKIYDGRA